jgi:uncharacterized sulfatase
MDERYDLVRSVRNERYVYIRNYRPDLIYGQYIDYMFQTPTTRVWKTLYDQGRLKPPQRLFWERKSPEELYDLQSDPDEVRNLAASSAHRTVLEGLRQAQREHALRIRDVGFLSEAEMHRRSAGSTPYELGHDPEKYPLVRILAMADLASLPTPNDLSRLKDGLREDDSAVRYWAAMGLLIRGQAAVATAGDELRAALKDGSPTVRIIAARALGQYGNEADLGLVRAVLRELAPPDKNGAYASILALNTIDALGERAAPLREMLKAMPTDDPQAVGRANGYVARLKATILGEENAKPQPKAKRAGAKARKNKT